MYFVDTHFPNGKVSTTARLGRKWFDTVNVCDMLTLKGTLARTPFARAVVAHKELTTFGKVLETATDNHLAKSAHPAVARMLVYDSLREAYGPLKDDEPMSKIHFLPVYDELHAAVQALYYSAHWSPDRLVDEDSLWGRVRQEAGFSPGDSERVLGPASLEARVEKIWRRAWNARCNGEPSFRVSKQEWLDLGRAKKIESVWLNGQPVPTLAGIIIDRLDAEAPAQ